MHIIITGATGLVGSIALDILLNDPEVTKVSILTRSPVAQAWGHDKAEVIRVEDFGSIGLDVLDRLRDAHGCVWALGDTRKPGIDTADLDRINIDYPLIAAKAFTKGKTSFNFTFVSVYGIGNASWEDVVNKARAEQALMAYADEEPAFKLYSARLCATDTRGHAAVEKFTKYPVPWYRTLATWIIPVIKWWYPKLNIDSPDFGFLLAELAKSDGSPLEGEHVLEKGRVLDAEGFNPYVKKLRAKQSLPRSN